VHFYYEKLLVASNWEWEGSLIEDVKCMRGRKISRDSPSSTSTLYGV